MQEEVEGILFYQGRINSDNQLKAQDLDRCRFLDFMEIGQPVPVVLEDSLILYSYIMWIHNKINLSYGKRRLQENESSQGLKEVGEKNHLGVCEVQDKNKEGERSEDEHPQ